MRFLRLGTGLGLKAMKRFTVRPIPNASDDEATHFAITGPDVDKFTEMDRIAKFLEAALNAAHDFATKN